MAQFDNKTINRAFGAFIRQARERQDLRQTEVAEKVGLSQSFYCNIELGKREPNMAQVLNICDALGIDFNSFLQFLNKRQPRIVRSNIKENSTPR